MSRLARRLGIDIDLQPKKRESLRAFASRLVRITKRNQQMISNAFRDGKITKDEARDLLVRYVTGDDSALRLLFR